MVQVAAFENGELRLLSSDSDASEVVLALPLNRLLAKVLLVPPEHREDPSAYAREALQAMSPYPDEPLTAGCETVSETDRGLVVIAAALPESSSDGIAEALDAKKLNVTRIDLMFLGQLRGLWGSLGAAAGERKLLLVGGAESISLMVLDGELPVEIRALDLDGNLLREVNRSLIHAEEFGGSRPLSEIVAVGVDASCLAAFAPVRTLEIGEDAALVGVAERTLEPGSLNVLPESWAAVLAETRFKAKLLRNLAIAGGIWALVMAVLFGVPVVYGFMTDHQKSLSREHAKVYRSVRETKDKVELVKKYSDHDRGALEIMKAVSDRLPQGVELTSWSFKRDEGVKVSGEADNPDLVYEFKDQMSAVGTESEADDEDESAEDRVFNTVVLNGPSVGRGGKQKFDLDCRYAAEEAE